MSQQSNEPSSAIASLNSRIEIVESFYNEKNHLIIHAQKGIEKCFEKIETLEDKIATELEILKGFNDETQKGFNRLSERIDELENSIKEKHSDGIMCNCQLENRAHEITTSSSLNNLWTRQKFLEDRTKILEEWKKAAIEKNIQDVERMRKLEFDFENKLDVDYKKWIQYFNEVHPKKLPHKCPICDGAGKKYINPNAPLSGYEAMFAPKDEKGRSYHPCQPCETKGIVWG